MRSPAFKEVGFYKAVVRVFHHKMDVAQQRKVFSTHDLKRLRELGHTFHPNVVAANLNPYRVFGSGLTAIPAETPLGLHPSRPPAPGSGPSSSQSTDSKSCRTKPFQEPDWPASNYPAAAPPTRVENYLDEADDHQVHKGSRLPYKPSRKTQLKVAELSRRIPVCTGIVLASPFAAGLWLALVPLGCICGACMACVGVTA